jgi:peptide/nickel transport system permease protein
MSELAVPSSEASGPDWRRLAGPAIGAVLFALFLTSALLPGTVAPYDPNILDYTALLHPPSWTHPFGTDNLGRDML